LPNHAGSPGVAGAVFAYTPPHESDLDTSATKRWRAANLPGDVVSEPVTLPSGRSFDPNRTSRDGILDAEELEYCRANDVPIGYDTAQIGWVVVESEPTHPGEQPAAGSGATGITFRPWTDDDVPAHRALLDDPAVWETLPEDYPDPFTDATSSDLIALANAPIGHDVVAVEIDGQLVGQCMLRLDAGSSAPATAEVAYWLGRPHWGRGAMSRILPAFVERSFEEHPVDEIYAWILPGNEASIRVAERTGLVRTELPDEAELAASQGRPGFLRWTIARNA